MSTRRPRGGHRLIAGAGAVLAVLTVFTGAGGVAFGSTAGHAAPARATSRPASHRDPRHSVRPSSAFVDACYAVSRKHAAQRACDHAALPAFDKVRATEGLARMSLPAAFPRMSAPHQLLVLANIERADRGLHVFSGLSTRLDGYAVRGARAGTDPSFPTPFPGDFGGANWAGIGSSTLLADYVWMYDDGVDSPNGSCRSRSDSACWGHRHNIIHAYHGPRAIGVAVAQHGRSMAEELIGGDHTDHPSSPRWSTLSRTIPVGVSTTHTTVHAPVGGSGRVRVTVWASGEAMHVHATLATRGGTWRLSRSACRLAAGHSCVIVVTARPSTGGVHHATVVVTGPHDSRRIRLTERPTG